jgi:hypothetical protein
VEDLTSVLELSYNQTQTDSEIEGNCMNFLAPERDGFQLTSKTFVVPTDTSRLAPALKRKTTICNLFANHHLTIRDIMRILDEPCATVVGTLIEFGLVYERRHDRQEPVKIERRQTFFRSL